MESGIPGTNDNPFFTTFTYHPVLGGYESGITRRDPSPVILVRDTYYVWYSRSTADASGYYADIWYATSSNGWDWKEEGIAIGKGGAGDWDENGVFTPSVLLAENLYYIFYTGVPRSFQQEAPPTPTAIGIAVAHNPRGPWAKFPGNPVLLPGSWGAFDSCRVDDSCLIVRSGGYWLYYKGREQGGTPAETKMGLAVAERPTGPYKKHPANPLIGSGHEVCVWPHRRGVAALVAPTGPEGGTVQYSQDGIHFSVMAEVAPPGAPGPYRSDHYHEVEHGDGITWGICQCTVRSERPFLMRFDCQLTPR